MVASTSRTEKPTISAVSKTRVPIEIGEHVITGAAVVLAIHQRDGQEMRKLPEKEYGEEKPGLPVDGCRSARPADQRWHGAGKSAQKRAERRLALERRIDQQIREQRRNREQGRQGIDRDQQIESTGDAQKQAERQSLAAREPARRQRTRSGAAHLAVPHALHPLIQSCGAAGHQQRAYQGVDQAGDVGTGHGTQDNNPPTWSSESAGLLPAWSGCSSPGAWTAESWTARFGEARCLPLRLRSPWFQSWSDSLLSSSA